jgi:uncharacterized membrane protein HdeD (DUF308 family)
MKLSITGIVPPDVWRMVILRGILALIFGLLLLVHPERTIVVLLQILGVFCLIEGFLLVIAAIFGHIYEIRWGALLGRGLLSVLAGVMILSHPLVSAVITVSLLAYILGLIAIVFGVMEIIMGLGIRETLSNKWSLIIGGILACILGLLLLFHPFVSAAAAMSITGVVITIVGLGWILLAFRLRKIA